MQPRLTYDDVATAVKCIIEAGGNPSLRLILKQLGRGSLTTIAQHLATYRDAHGGHTGKPSPPVAFMADAESIYKRVWEEALRQAPQDLQDDLARVQGENAQLRKDNDDTISNLAIAEERAEHAAMDRDRWHARSVEVEHHLETKSAALSDLIIRANEWKSRYEKADSDLTATHQRLLRATETMEATKIQEAMTETARKALEVSHDSLRRDLDEHHDKEMILQRTLADLQRTCDELQGSTIVAQNALRDHHASAAFQAGVISRMKQEILHLRLELVRVHRLLGSARTGIHPKQARSTPVAKRKG